ncbi:MAG: 3,4-dihydroxy-2-butanone-4-phosphate synthase [Hydrotalea sp.]|nr:3,4-dihydroxy-2-butanone-4-phosphate synthase [Hydrotalea sp.]
MADNNRDNIEQALAALKAGKMILVKDDDDREGEGDLIAAASTMSEAAMAFMIRHTSGIICAPLTPRRAKALALNEMVPGQHNDAPHQTAFTISIDAKENLTTGISAKERLTAVRLLANPNALANDFVRPGHVFPLIAKPGGVLTRAGHTEAAVDLTAMAGLPDVGVIGELVNDDGTVKKGKELTDFATTHDLITLTIAEIISHRQSREQLLTMTEQKNIMVGVAGKDVAATLFTYQTIFDRMQHYALVFGAVGGDAKITTQQPVMVRLQVENLPNDVFTTNNDLQMSLGILAKEAASKPAVLIYLRQGAVGVAAHRDHGHDNADNDGDKNKPHGDNNQSHQMRQTAWREVGIGAQILKQLGITRINLLARHEKQYLGLSGFGLTIEQFTKL